MAGSSNIEEQINFEVSPFCFYIQTVHIYFYTRHQHVEQKKKSYQTVIPSSDGMLNASTDSVHEHTLHTHAHDTRAYKQDTYALFFCLFTLNNTFYINAPKLRFFNGFLLLLFLILLFLEHIHVHTFTHI